MALTGLLDRVDRGDATEKEAASYRVLVNANKFVTSIEATGVVHRGIEVLGGNGTIETFSPLPRLYRDAIVYESWEGTHNVLCAQVQRDAVRLGVIDPFVAWVRDQLSNATSQEADRVAVVLDELESRVRRSLADPGWGSSHFRAQLERLTRAAQAACLLSEAASGGDSEKTAVATYFVRRHLTPDLDPEADPGWSDLVDAVLGDDLG